MHNDAYSTDAYDVSGPLGHNLKVRSRSYGVRECATIAFDSQDRMVGLCGGLEGFTMMVINPVTLNVVDELRVSARDLTSGANPLTDICGGTYFFLDPNDHAFATTTDSGIAEVAVAADGTLTRVRDWPMASYLPEGDCLVATGVDWSGRLWWFSQQGVVGTLDRASGQVQTVALPAGEGIFNSVSSDETGGMYLVTTHASYRLDAARRRCAAGVLADPLRPRHQGQARHALAGIRHLPDPDRRPLDRDRRQRRAAQQRHRLRPPDRRDRPAALPGAGARERRQHDREQPGGGGQIADHREQLRLQRRPGDACSGSPRRPAWRG